MQFINIRYIINHNGANWNILAWVTRLPNKSRRFMQQGIEK